MGQEGGDYGRIHQGIKLLLCVLRYPLARVAYDNQGFTCIIGSDYFGSNFLYIPLLYGADSMLVWVTYDCVDLE